MKVVGKAISVTLLFAAVAHSLPAHAGRACDADRPSARTIELGLGLAQRTHAALESAHQVNGTRVVLLARAGQDLTRHGLRYSHLGFAYRTQDSHGRAAWRVVHKLNQCGTAEGALFRHGLGEFFMDELWRYEAAWVVPVPDLQARLLPVLEANARALKLHHVPYSMVSYPWSTRFQQSNQWAVETIALAAEPAISERTEAQAWLRLKRYQPTTLNIGPLERLGGRMTAANVSFDDHPPEKRFSDRIDTVTVESVFEWLQRNQFSGPLVIVR